MHPDYFPHPFRGEINVHVNTAPNKRAGRSCSWLDVITMIGISQAHIQLFAVFPEQQSVSRRVETKGY
ncbi:MAG: hypothetical protein Ct9H300mP21_07530 [Pseudomonadota bacterium]|nr:MAG: hypothetical protein Ct9H300mP21_07530 [Pseudomonadota bacterium]